MSDSTIRILLDWNAIEAGQFKPVKFHPEVLGGRPIKVAVDVPLNHKHVANADAVIMNQLYPEKECDPILTLYGMRYVLDQVQNESMKTDENSDDEWEVIEEPSESELE